MKILEIYTDGSHLDKQNGGRLGCGGVLVDPSQSGRLGKLIDSFSEELTPEVLRREIGTDKVSNPTAEMFGTLKAIEHFGEYLKDVDQVIFFADYNGVKYFLEGKWRAKELYISSLKDKILRELNKLGLIDKSSFEWVKGHQSKSVLSRDAYWNNMCDKLAKGENN